jgi:hypothetical protein
MDDRNVIVAIDVGLLWPSQAPPVPADDTAILSAHGVPASAILTSDIARMPRSPIATKHAPTAERRIGWAPPSHEGGR